MLKWVDQGSILLVVYTAFSEAVNEGLWRNTPLPALIGLMFICIVILALALAGSLLIGRFMKFDTADRITLLFCGSKKSLSSGIPMAQVIFAGQSRRRNRLAVDDLSPDSAYGVCGHCRALRQAIGLSSHALASNKKASITLAFLCLGVNMTAGPQNSRIECWILGRSSALSQ